jgi:hypothetical protein
VRVEVHADPADGCPTLVVISEGALDEETLLTFCKAWPTSVHGYAANPRCARTEMEQAGDNVLQRRIIFKPFKPGDAA